MSITRRVDGRGWLLSHQDFIDSLYRPQGVRSRDYFEVLTPFRKDAEAAKIAEAMKSNGAPATTSTGASSPPAKRRRRREARTDPFAREKLTCQGFLEKLVLEGAGSLFRPRVTDPEVVARNNAPVRNLVRRLEEDWPKKRRDRLDLVLPDNSDYVEATLGEGGVRDALGVKDGKFGLALADPPWENKHVRRERRRGKGYSTEEAPLILRILSGLVEALEEDGVLVLWCTPSLKARQAAQQFLRTSGLQTVARWV